MASLTSWQVTKQSELRFPAITAQAHPTTVSYSSALSALSELIQIQSTAISCLFYNSKPGFLKNKLRANVALTRAKKHLILVGNLRFFTDLTEKGHDTHFGHFIRHFLPTSEMLKRNDIINGKRFSFGAGSGSSVARSRRMEPLEGLLSALRIEYLK